MDNIVNLFHKKNEIILNDERFKEVDLEEYIMQIFVRDNVLNFQEKNNYEP